MKLRVTMGLAAMSAGLLAAGQAQAVSFSPTQAELFNIVDVTTDFGGGGLLYTGAGTAYGTVGTDAVRYDMDFTPGSATDGLSRVVLENQTFSMDLSSFSSFDILFQSETLPTMNVKTYIRTGASGFFESIVTPSNSSDFEPARVSIDLSSIPDLNDVNGFGIQMFVPENPAAVAQTALVQTAPELVPTELIPVATIDSFERPTLLGGGTGDGWGYAKFEPGPTESDTTFTVTTVGATDGTNAAKFGRAAGSPESFQWSLQRVWTSSGDGRPVAADANNDLPNDTEVPIITQGEVDTVAADFNDATHIAFDVTYDPADFDATATFASLSMHINEGSGAFYQVQGLGAIDPSGLTEPTTISLEVPFNNFLGANNGGLSFESQGVAAGSDTIILGFATNIGNAGGSAVSGAAIIDNLRLLKEVPITALAGDLDGDGFVGINDLNIVLGNWNQNVPPADPAADPSGDGFVGIDDLNEVLGNWNAGTPPSADSVPEPSTLALLALGGAAVYSRRR